MKQEPEPTRFDPAELVEVETVEQIESVDPESCGVFVRRLDDTKLAAIAVHLATIRHLITDGSTTVTDAGLKTLAQLEQLERLDLEWSLISDQGLESIGAVKTLRWVDVGFCRGVTEDGVARLRESRPDLEVVFAQV